MARSSSFLAAEMHRSGATLMPCHFAPFPPMRLSSPWEAGQGFAMCPASCAWDLLASENQSYPKSPCSGLWLPPADPMPHACLALPGRLE